MTNAVSHQPPAFSPSWHDSTPTGEADVEPDQIAVLEPGSTGTEAWGSDGIGFTDVLDIINPLQHIPIVSSIYRAVTGDEIAAAPRAIGGALFGGPVGLVAAIGNSIMEAETGADIGDTAIALFTGADEAPDAGNTGHRTAALTPQLASAAPQPPATTTPLIETLAKTAAPRVPGAYIPSDAAVRAGLFSGAGKPVPASANFIQDPRVANSEFGGNLQSAPAGALDRLIARSQAASNTAPSNSGLKIPTESGNVHQWMLRALGKYETMPKG
jgi:hypothetical protein